MKKLKCPSCGKQQKVGVLDIGQLKDIRNYSCPNCGTLYFFEDKLLINDKELYAFNVAYKNDNI